MKIPSMLILNNEDLLNYLKRIAIIYQINGTQSQILEN
jgi:hypothetical protein